ncbi:MAG: protein tyrosine phosphatase [Chloroflexi bacterium]|nr:protein tyrosine phosphatase [Chloroflexota bacterium]|tara:strand:- start:35507 stop:35818 length:312 start_codon:yes stop_codon:yes gene_type:complete
MNKLLFVCSGNKLRSPTAEVFFEEQGFETRSAGTSRDAVNVIGIEDIKWADKIYVMEKKHKQRILAEYPRVTKYKKIVVMGIPDNYKYMDDKLIEVLKKYKIQ